MKLMVDADDFVFKQFDGTEVFRVEDNGDFDIAGGAGSTGVTVSSAGQITADGDWWITNNLEYARRAAFDPGYVGRRGTGAGDWFTAIVTGLPKDAERTIDFFLRKIK